MTVFVVVRYAIYRHECGGVYPTLERAKAATDALKAAEPDAHHDFQVIPYELDLVPPLDPKCRNPSWLEPDEVYDTHRPPPESPANAALRLWRELTNKTAGHHEPEEAKALQEEIREAKQAYLAALKRGADKP